MVRQFRNTTDINLLIIPDFTENGFTEESKRMIWDKLIESSIALVYYCLTKYIPVDLVCYKDNINKVSVRDISSFPRIYEDISESEYDKENFYPNILNTFMPELDSDSNIILITSKLNYELYTEIYKAVLSGKYIILLYLEPIEAKSQISDISKKILEDLPKIGAKIFRIGAESDIKSELEVQQ